VAAVRGEPTRHRLVEGRRRADEKAAETGENLADQHPRDDQPGRRQPWVAYRQDVGGPEVGGRLRHEAVGERTRCLSGLLPPEPERVRGDPQPRDPEQPTGDDVREVVHAEGDPAETHGEHEDHHECDQRPAQARRHGGQEDEQQRAVARLWR
jgi:hypothetical protein